MGKVNTQSKKSQQLQTVRTEVATPVSLKLLIQKWWKQISNLYAVLQFHFHRLTLGTFKTIKLPFFELSVLAIALCIFFQKDLQFQVRMSAPNVQQAAPQNTSYTEPKVDQLSVAPTFSFGSDEKTSSSTKLAQAQIEAYIKRFAKVAVAEHHKFGIPASVKMAQALLESQAGQIPAAATLNNHFGAPLTSGTFSSAWENWRAHSLLFSSEQHPYQQLLKHNKDYKKWAKGLEQLNYSLQPNYAARLIQLIEEYELFRLDTI
ncbi:MAG: glucosaminidase domain-containing protein [Bacteroidota bacterium]